MRSSERYDHREKVHISCQQDEVQNVPITNLTFTYIVNTVQPMLNAWTL